MEMNLPKWLEQVINNNIKKAIEGVIVLDPTASMMLKSIYVVKFQRAH